MREGLASRVSRVSLAHDHRNTRGHGRVVGDRCQNFECLIELLLGRSRLSDRHRRRDLLLPSRVHRGLHVLNGVSRLVGVWIKVHSRTRVIECLFETARFERDARLANPCAHLLRHRRPLR